MGSAGYRGGMVIRVLGLALVTAACVGPTTSPTSPETLPPPSTIVVTTTTIPRPAPLPLCDPPGYFPSVLPGGVTSPEDDPDLPADRYTSIEGSSTAVFVDEDGAAKVVIIRGSLPPDDWAGRTVRVEVDGTRAALGTMPDGAWAVAWAETGARCDQYSLIIYPPSSREEVALVASGLER